MNHNAVSQGFLSIPARIGPSGAVRPPPRIVHLGVGAFFRAHMAQYLSEIGGWGVTGVSLRASSVRDLLAPQECVYTAVALDPACAKATRIEVLRDVLVAPEDPESVLGAMAAAQTEIVSLTITEKGYCHDPAHGTLNLCHPDIQRDVHADVPCSALGFVVRALGRRRAAGLAPFTVMSCDNLPANGVLTRNVVLALAREIDPNLAGWIADHGAFPSTMADRIVPATQADDIDRVRALIGQRDQAPVLHEPFRQWVIEDHFAGACPDFAAAGAQLVADVAPFQHMKLRMLNGAQSALAYLGVLQGHEFVSGAARAPDIAEFLNHLWLREIAPTLNPPPGTELGTYAGYLKRRFTNPELRHSTHQIAMDGSQKIPQRLLHTIQDRLQAGQGCDGLLLAVSAWVRYTLGTDEAGREHIVRDPLATVLRDAHDVDPAKTVENVLKIDSVFAPEFASQIATPLTEIYSGLLGQGARAMIRKICQ